MKSNMMKIAADYNISITEDPKIELYGNAEERMLLDLKIVVKEEEHFIKMKVYNTTCAMDFQALKHDIDKKFEHLGGLTVAQYFTQTVVVEIANILCNKIDIKKLNNYIRKLASDGKTAVKTFKKCAKFACSKDISKGGTISCIYCESLTHRSCIDNSILETSKYRCETCLINNVNTIQSDNVVENNDILKLSLLCDLKIAEPSYLACTLCSEMFETDTDLQYHVSEKHVLPKDYNCSVCSESFQDEKDLKIHIESKHELRKRLRADTSLLESRCDCTVVSKENEILTNKIKTEKENSEKIKLELEATKKDVKTKIERVEYLEDQARRELEKKMEDVHELKEKIKSLEEDIGRKNVLTEDLKKENEVLRKTSQESLNQETNQELQRLRAIIQDREKA